MDEDQIRKDAAEIIWDAVQSLPSSEPYFDFDGLFVRAVYLGSVLSIIPSGKYYTPWANSNVDDCELCEGTGRGPLMQCPYCEGLGERDYFEYNPQLGLMPCHTCHGTGELHDACPDCCGLGSREAHLDEVMSQALEEEAEKFDCTVGAGEGDPTDLFLYQFICREEECDELLQGTGTAFREVAL